MKNLQIPAGKSIVLVLLVLLTPIVLVISAVADSDIPVLIWAIVCLILAAVFMFPNAILSARLARMRGQVRAGHPDTSHVLSGIWVDKGRRPVPACVTTTGRSILVAIEDSSSIMGLAFVPVFFGECRADPNQGPTGLSFRLRSGSTFHVVPLHGLFARRSSPKELEFLAEKLRSYTE